MRLFTTLCCVLLLAPAAVAQQLEAFFSPTPTTDIKAAFASGIQNGARGISGPWDLDRDGKMEILVAQHSAGGRIHVLENTAPNTWELVYSTAVIDSSASANNARYAIGADLDGDGNWEIVTIAGNLYKNENRVDSIAAVGAYIWEHDGVVGSDNYGMRPASIVPFYSLDGSTALPSVHAQSLAADDVDGDGQQELIVPLNGANVHDLFFIVSVNGTFEPENAGQGFESWIVEQKVGPRLEAQFGGGSPIAVNVADLNGDGRKDITFHSWNNFALFNATSTAANTYELPTAETPDPHIKVTAGDNTALFGSTVVDIDGDGTDEIFYIDFQGNQILVVDYDKDDDVLSIPASKVSNEADAIKIGTNGGITHGDLDQDGQPELIVGGAGFTGGQWDNGTPSRFIRVAEYNGGDPKLGSSYSLYTIDTSDPADSLSLHTVYRDSLGTQTKYHITASSKAGNTPNPFALGFVSDPYFPSMITYLGDVDGDGDVEVALSFQGVDDSLSVYDEVWTTFQRDGQADTSYYVQTLRERFANPRRDFVRIYSFTKDFALSANHLVVLPSDYVLEDNYPNPFSNSTNIRFTLPLTKQISARVYDLQGRLVRTLVADQLFEAGPHEVTWDGRSDSGAEAASGVYVVRLEYGNFSQSRTMVLVK